MSKFICSGIYQRSKGNQHFFSDTKSGELFVVNDPATLPGTLLNLSRDAEEISVGEHDGVFNYIALHAPAKPASAPDPDPAATPVKEAPAPAAPQDPAPAGDVDEDPIFLCVKGDGKVFKEGKKYHLVLDEMEE